MRREKTFGGGGTRVEPTTNDEERQSSRSTAPCVRCVYSTASHARALVRRRFDADAVAL
jgi:hypothetical protein